MTITHAGRKLAGSVYLKGDEAGSMTFRLQPWGTITGRIMDEDGQPRDGLGLTNLGRIYYPEQANDRGILPASAGRPSRCRVRRDADSASRAWSPA